MRHRRPIALATAVLAVALVTSPTVAATRNVSMNDGYDFMPSSVTIARGDSVKWTNNANFEEHDVTALKPSGYFRSGPEGGMEPDDSYTRRFKSSGRFPYTCLVHSGKGMQGVVIVPMAATKVVVNGVTKFKLTVATEALPSSSPYRHFVEVDPPGSQGWKPVTTTRNAIVYHTPGVRGTFAFRTRVKRTSNGQSSDPVYKYGLTY